MAEPAPSPATWQTEACCRKCGARAHVRLEAGGDDTGGLAIFYCPACGERCQVEHPGGYDPLSVTATPAAG
ncbi:MAG TPA: hypothetical protein VI669_09475 [Vicinamibacteria bacterium]